MKRGNRGRLPVNIGIDLNTVEKIEFIFKQGKNEKYVVYPSDDATRRENENIIDISWTGNDTILFSADKKIGMDTRIHITGSSDQPDTSIVYFHMNDTLFEKAVEDD